MRVRSRCQRLFTVTLNRTFKTLRIPRPVNPETPHLHLCPSVVDSTVSSCPSDALALSFFLWCARQPSYFHAPRSFDLMVPVVLRLTERLGSVAAVVDDLESIGCPRKAQALMVLLRIYWRSDMYGMALEAFDEMPSRNIVPNTFARNMVLDVLFKIGRFDAAMRFLRETQFPNFLTFNIVLCNLCKSGDWVGVRGVLREMVKKGFCLNTGTFSMAFNCCRKAGRVMELLQLLAFMIVSGERPSVTVWTMLLDCFCRIGRVDVACRLLGKMMDSGCNPTVVTYTSVIKGLFKMQMHNEAFELLDAMLLKRCVPDLVLYNVLVDCLRKSRRYDDAIDVFFYLRESKIEPDAYTLSSLMPVLCLSGKMSFLPKLVAGLDISVDLVVCNSLLIFLCKAGFPSQAVEFYRDMIDKGLTLDNYSFTGLLSALCKLGRIDYAVNVYRAIVVNNPDIDAYVHTAIFDGLIKRGMHHKAIRLFREAVSGNYRLDVVSYTIAIHGLFKGGRFDNACSLFNQMKQSGVVPNIYTYNVMLRGLCKARDINAVKQLLEDKRIAGTELDSISLNTIMGLMFKLQRVRPAFLLFMEMCNLGMKPNSAIHFQLLNALYHICNGEVEDLCPQLTYYLVDAAFVVSNGSDNPDDLPLCSGG